MGLEKFMRRAADVGVDGILVLDLPIEEADALRDAAGAVNIDPIFLLSPTTTSREFVGPPSSAGDFCTASRGWV